MRENRTIFSMYFLREIDEFMIQQKHNLTNSYQHF